MVAFYGDPKCRAKLAPCKLAYGQTLESKEGVFTLVIQPKLGSKSFDAVNNNGSQRGGRPCVAFLPQRSTQAELLEGVEFSPVITDDFILIPRPAKCNPKRAYRVKFRADDLGL